MSNDYKENIKQQSTWKRGLYMLMFAIFYQIAEIVMFMTVFFQFLFKLLTGSTNEQLRNLSQSLGSYIYQVIQFLGYNSEYHPYPLGEWPQADTDLNKYRTADSTHSEETPKKIEQDTGKEDN